MPKKWPGLVLSMVGAGRNNAYPSPEECAVQVRSVRVSFLWVRSLLLAPSTHRFRVLEETHAVILFNPLFHIHHLTDRKTKPTGLCLAVGLTGWLSRLTLLFLNLLNRWLIRFPFTRARPFSLLQSWGLPPSNVMGWGSIPFCLTNFYWAMSQHWEYGSVQGIEEGPTHVEIETNWAGIHSLLPSINIRYSQYDRHGAGIGDIAEKKRQVESLL